MIDEGSSPVNNAEVTFNNEVVGNTDIEGVLQIDTSNGTYQYAVSKSGYENNSGAMTVADSDVEKTVTLTKEVTDILTLESNKIRVYPNPTKGVVHIRTNVKPLKIKVFNINGKPVYSKTLYSDDVINLNALSAGLYIMQIKKENEVEYLKIVIEK